MSVSHSITGGLVHLSGNPIQIILTANAARVNHKLALKITCAALMGSPFVEEIAPKNLVSVFDISGLIDQPVAYEFDYPGLGKVAAHQALAFMVTIDIGEVWTDSNGDRQLAWMGISTNNQLRIIKGKLRQYELGLLNDEGKNFNSEYIEGGKFLTHLPDKQVVSPNQIIKLWYLSRWTGNHVSNLNFTITTDLKIARIPITEEVILIGNGLFEFSVNPSFIGYEVNPGENILSYTFWLSDSEGDISERRTFMVDNTWHEVQFFFYYVNPLSGIDCIRLTGQYTEGLKTESEIAYRSVPVLSGSKIASQTTVSSSSQRTWELNTGPKSRSEMLALRDFLTSRQCWMVDPDNTQKLIPVNIEAADHRLYAANEDIQNLDIKILEAHK
ncbi:MAG: hypothetical protein WAO52_02395 [Prolixibacteraceae bacterium]